MPTKNTPNGQPDPTGLTDPKADSTPKTDSPQKTAPAATPSEDSPVTARKKQYLIAQRVTSGFQLAGLRPLSMDLVEQTLKDNPDVDYVKTIKPKGFSQLAAGLGDSAPSIVVAQMDQNHADVLRLSGAGQLIIEEDLHISIAPPVFPQSLTSPSRNAPTTTQTNLTIVVRGKDTNAPVPEAEVYLFGSLLPVQGVTDANGEVTLTLVGQTPDTARGLYVNPKADYWGYWLPRPALDTNSKNVVTVTPLSGYFPNFPNQQVIGWGQKAMKMDQLPPEYRGQGVKVAVIDSGAAAKTHMNLEPNLFEGGVDITNPQNADGWKDDTVGHGTHCSGIIAGLDTGKGIRGFAPEADIYAYKIFPGGQYSDLISALDDCINQGIDVVNLSLGTDQPSELVSQKIQQAKDLGVACIVAAGNSGGVVQFPASLPSVLAVAAVGKMGEFPPDTFHGTQVASTGVNAAGWFSASFTCFGPEVGVCAPGVAILSSVPPNDFAAWDGTSMATPHVTGLAALLLAHHPDFQRGGPFAARNGQRVDHLFQLIKLSAQPLDLGDPTRTGAGLPDATRAFSIAASAGAPAAAGLFGASPGVAAGSPSGVVASQLGAYLPYTGGAGAYSYGVPPPGTPAGPGASPAPQYAANAAVQWLGTMLQQLGLLSGAGGAVAPQSATPTAPQPAPRADTGDGAAGAGNNPTMQQLASSLRQAGLLK